MQKVRCQLAVSLMMLKFKSASYAYGETTELFIGDNCAGCGMPRTWLRWRYLPWIGLKLAARAVVKHHKTCPLWKILGTSTDFQEGGEYVLFGREVYDSERSLHASTGFTVIDNWPEEQLVRHLFDYPQTLLPSS